MHDNNVDYAMIIEESAKYMFLCKALRICSF